jgi:peroxiredoxin Q/BCP
MLKPGDLAPDFRAATDAGQEIRLKDLRGRKVILYFYPKDDTPGCTQEACEFRDLHPRFDQQGAVVLGVSPDAITSHLKFKTKFALPFTLLSDQDKQIAAAYGVWKEKSLYGRKYMGVERTTFLIDEKGRIEQIWQKVKVKGHAAELLAAVSGK